MSASTCCVGAVRFRTCGLFMRIRILRGTASRQPDLCVRRRTPVHKKALDFLRFPSNRSVGNCRKDAKRLADQTGRPLHQCLHDVAVANGVPDGWDAAMKLLVERAMRRHGDLPAEMSQDDLIAISRRVPKLTQYGLGLRAELALIRPDFDYRAELERERELLLTKIDQCY